MIGTMRRRLSPSFYAQPAPKVARALLGALLVHIDGGVRRAGRIVETEAYLGPHDLASHARHGPKGRSELMFGAPGRAYIYRIYGIHDCFNVVTEPHGRASAVLVRALAPLDNCLGPTSGPGKLCKALAISIVDNGADLRGGELYIEPGPPVAARDIARGPRVGVDYAGPWAHRVLRFWIASDPWVSRPR